MTAVQDSIVVVSNAGRAYARVVMYSPLQLVFSILMTLQFLVITLHDWLEIPGWTHGSQVQAVAGRRRFLLATVANAFFPGIAVAFVFLYRPESRPSFVATYWVIYCAVTVLSAVMMWWVPYFFGASQQVKDEMEAMYSGTRQVLPARGDNPRPNLIHLYFHALFLCTLSTALLMKFR